MSTKIRLKRLGTKRRPAYRIVVMDSRAPRDGRAIEEVGIYQPISGSEADQVRFDEEKIKAWLEKGAQPTPTVRQLLNKHNLTIR